MGVGLLVLMRRFIEGHRNWILAGDSWRVGHWQGTVGEDTWGAAACNGFVTDLLKSPGIVATRCSQKVHPDRILALDSALMVAQLVCLGSCRGG